MTAEQQLADLRDAAADLLALKDGPRDDDYEHRKPIAWDRLRTALIQESADLGGSPSVQHFPDAYRSPGLGEQLSGTRQWPRFGHVGAMSAEQQLTDLRASITALADDWASWTPSLWDEPARDLRALLDNPTTAEGER
jgi:hypothetical protein